jgi:hypothetical protein
VLLLLLLLLLLPHPCHLPNSSSCSECQVYSSPKQPTWSGSKRDWFKNHDSFKQDSNSRYRHSWTSYGSYYNDGSSSDRCYVDSVPTSAL